MRLVVNAIDIKLTCHANPGVGSGKLIVKIYGEPIRILNQNVCCSSFIAKRKIKHRDNIKNEKT